MKQDDKNETHQNVEAIEVFDFKKNWHLIEPFVDDRCMTVHLEILMQYFLACRMARRKGCSFYDCTPQYDRDMGPAHYDESDFPHGQNVRGTGSHRWYQCYGADQVLAIWLEVLGRRVFPQYEWAVRIGERHSLAYGKDSAGNIKMIFDILYFDQMTANQLLASASSEASPAKQNSALVISQEGDASDAGFPLAQLRALTLQSVKDFDAQKNDPQVASGEGYSGLLKFSQTGVPPKSCKPVSEKDLNELGYVFGPEYFSVHNAPAGKEFCRIYEVVHAETLKTADFSFCRFGTSAVGAIVNTPYLDACDRISNAIRTHCSGANESN